MVCATAFVLWDGLEIDALNPTRRWSAVDAELSVKTPETRPRPPRAEAQTSVDVVKGSHSTHKHPSPPKIPDPPKQNHKPRPRSRPRPEPPLPDASSPLLNGGLISRVGRRARPPQEPIDALVETGAVVRAGIPNGKPFLVLGPGGRRAFVCVQEKVGSTMWRKAFTSLQTGLKPSDVVRPHSLHEWTPDEIRSALRDPTVPRAMLVRNPYTRFMSAYLDKIRGDFDRWTEIIPGLTPTMRESAEAFSAHVETLRNVTEAHFALQTAHCALPDGMHFDYFLKIEEMEQWYVDFVSLLNMQRPMRCCWDFYGQKCFFKLPGKTCDQTLPPQAPPASNPTALPSRMRRVARDGPTPRRAQPPRGAIREKGVRFATDHSVGTSVRMRYFYTKRAAATIARYYARDFAMFGYDDSYEDLCPGCYEYADVHEKLRAKKLAN